MQSRHTHMLVDEKDSDILSLGKLVKGLFNCGDLGFYVIVSNWCENEESGTRSHLQQESSSCPVH